MCLNFFLLLPLHEKNEEEHHSISSSTTKQCQLLTSKSEKEPPPIAIENDDQCQSQASAQGWFEEGIMNQPTSDSMSIPRVLPLEISKDYQLYYNPI